jgi:phosphopantetheine adenylyltransferase
MCLSKFKQIEEDIEWFKSQISSIKRLEETHGNTLSTVAIKTLCLVVEKYEMALEILKIQEELINRNDKLHEDLLSLGKKFQTNSESGIRSMTCMK